MCFSFSARLIFLLLFFMPITSECITWYASLSVACSNNRCKSFKKTFSRHVNFESTWRRVDPVRCGALSSVVVAVSLDFYEWFLLLWFFFLTFLTTHFSTTCGGCVFLFFMAGFPEYKIKIHRLLKWKKGGKKRRKKSKEAQFMILYTWTQWIFFFFSSARYRQRRNIFPHR